MNVGSGRPPMSKPASSLTNARVMPSYSSTALPSSFFPWSGSEGDERRLPYAAAVRGDEVTDECAGGAVVLKHRVAELACDQEVAAGAVRHALGLIQAAEAGGDEDALEGTSLTVVALDLARLGAAEEQVALGAKDHAARIQDVAARRGDELLDERIVPRVVDQDLARCCFRSAGDIEQT